MKYHDCIIFGVILTSMVTLYHMYSATRDVVRLLLMLTKVLLYSRKLSREKTFEDGGK